MSINIWTYESPYTLHGKESNHPCSSLHIFCMEISTTGNITERTIIRSLALSSVSLALSPSCDNAIYIQGHREQ